MSEAGPSSPPWLPELQRIFLELRQLPRAEREQRLVACRSRDSELGLALEELLRADESNTGFLERPALGDEVAWSAVAAEESSAHVVPERIGRYWIQGVLGRGGMGVVYRAGQENPRREVALKVLRGSRVTPARLKRFEHEAELLARLQHPGIAQVFEAGTVLEDGRIQAFIAMELVAGEDLRAHARREEHEELGARARLDLLRRIAEAVAHAHQKGVVHRDLKPENILVDAAGGPKIVDFGVARLVGTESDLTTLHTEAGRLIGTPWYMSPEQLSGDPDAADTRSDVYALGVIGHELCAGRMPYELEKKPLAEVARIIRDVEPSQLDPARLAAPDLGPVLRKCLEKDPARRYGSASELAADLARVLANEPITARPPSGIYLARKFVRRNRGLSAGIALALLALAAGVAGVAAQARRAAVQRDRALAAEDLAQERLGEMQRERDRAMAAEKSARESLAEAQRERDKFEASFTFLDRLLLSVDPTRDGKDARVADVLARGGETLAGLFPGDPATEGELRRKLGAAWRALGDPGRALEELRAALELFELDPGSTGLDEARGDVALVLMELGRLDEAEQLFRLALEHQQALADPGASATQITRNNLAGCLARLGRLEESEQLYRTVLAAEPGLRAEEYGPRLVASARRGLASQLQEQGQLGEARTLLEEALRDLSTAFGDGDAEVLSVLNNLGSLEASAGNLERAIEHLERSRAGYAVLVPAEHPALLTLDNNLGTLLVRAGRPAEGEQRLRAALEGRRAVLGPENPSTLTTASNLGGAWLDLGRTEEAEELLRETRDALERSLPAGHWMPHATGVKLAQCWIALERREAARELLEESLAGLRSSLGAGSEKTRGAAHLLAGLCEELGEAERAEELRREFGAGNE